MPQAGQTLDGYHLIRLIGAGGFGEVWLCQMESTGEYRALKFLPQTREFHLDRELQALKTYRAEIGHRSNSSLVPIEHVNRVEDGLFYVMPLADGPPGVEPDDPAWKPVTMETLIEDRRAEAAWFGTGELASIFAPLANALQTLSDAGLVHRDIKPQNILFFGGAPQIADIGLVTADEATLSRLGTPGYLAPQWYMSSQGNPDMWGFAATLYHCATGNHPDYMSRPGHRWPPSGKQNMTGVEQKKWLELIGIVYRATQEKPSERFVQFRDLANALERFLPSIHTASIPAQAWSKRKIFLTALAAVAVVLAAIGSVKGWHWYEAGRSQRSSEKELPTTPPSQNIEKTTPAEGGYFETVLKNARSRFSVDRPPVREQTLKFRALLKRLETLTTASIDEIRQTFAELEDLAPGVKKELTPVDRVQLNVVLGELYAAANQPQHLTVNGQNPPDSKAASEMMSKATAFQNEVEARNSATLVEAADLPGALTDSTVKLVDARKKNKSSPEAQEAAVAEANQIYRMRDAVEKMLPMR